MPVAGFEPTTLGLRVECSPTVPLGYTQASLDLIWEKIHKTSYDNLKIILKQNKKLQSSYSGLSVKVPLTNDYKTSIRQFSRARDRFSIYLSDFKAELQLQKTFCEQSHRKNVAPTFSYHYKEVCLNYNSTTWTAIINPMKRYPNLLIKMRCFMNTDPEGWSVLR